MTRRPGFLILFGFLLGGHAAAAPNEGKCTEAAYAVVGKHLKIEEFASRRQGGSVIAESCKTLPDDGDLMLSVFAYDAGVENQKQIIVAIINKKSKRVVSTYKKDVDEDAITEVGEYSLKLDTAPYQLAADMRAYGVRFRSSARGASCGEARSGDELTLFVPEGRNLRPVLSLDMYQQRLIQGCIGAATGSDIWREANLAIDIADSVSNGFHDLRVIARINVDGNVEPPPRVKITVQRHILRYDGKSYKTGKNIPWWLGI